MNYDEDTEKQYLIVPLETLDNQIDFNTLEIDNRPPGDDFSYRFVQLREVVSRDDKFDPVTKISIAADKYNDFFAVTLRKSSKVDFYYNGKRVSSYTGNITRV